MPVLLVVKADTAGVLELVVSPDSGSCAQWGDVPVPRLAHSLAETLPVSVPMLVCQGCGRNLEVALFWKLEQEYPSK